MVCLQPVQRAKIPTMKSSVTAWLLWFCSQVARHHSVVYCLEIFKVFLVSSNIAPSFIQITVSGPLSKPSLKCALWHDNSNDSGKRGVEVQASANNTSSVLVMQRLYSMTKKNNAITLCLIIIFKYLNCLLCCCLAKVRWYQQENGPAPWWYLFTLSVHGYITCGLFQLTCLVDSIDVCFKETVWFLTKSILGFNLDYIAKTMHLSCSLIHMQFRDCPVSNPKYLLPRMYIY